MDSCTELANQDLNTRPFFKCNSIPPRSKIRHVIHGSKQSGKQEKKGLAALRPVGRNAKTNLKVWLSAVNSHSPQFESCTCVGQDESEFEKSNTF